MYPYRCICLSEVALRLTLAKEEKYLSIIYFRIFRHLTVIIILKNHHMLIGKYIYDYSRQNILS